MEDNDKTPAATTDTAPADNVHGNAQDAPGVIITLNTGGKRLSTATGASRALKPIATTSATATAESTACGQ